MMKRNHTRLCASAAIAAALALSSTPLLAQVAEAPPPVAPDPVLTVPTEPAPPLAQPTIVIPTELEAAPAPTTTTTTTPAPERATPATTTTRTQRAPAPARPAARAPVAAPANPAPAPVAEDAAPIVPEADTLATEPVAPVAAVEPAPASAPADNDNAIQFGIAVIAAIAALVLAIWGFIAIGRRRPVDRKAATLIERPVVTPRQPEPEALAPSTVTPMATARPVMASPAPSMAHTGASVPLPSKMPETFAERDALIKRMIAAKPDRANPFTSPIQRRKRAKLILQSLGRDFGQADPWIDLSQYPANWPEVAGRKHAAA